MFDNKLNTNTLHLLQSLLMEINPFCRALRSITQRTSTQVDNCEDFRIILRAEVGTRRRRQYDLPTSAEIAVLMPGAADAADRNPRHILVQGRNDQLSTVSEIHWSYDPLQYVLMFPRGEKGWAPKTIPLLNRGRIDIDAEAGNDDSDADSEGDGNASSSKYVSGRQFYAYQLQVRPFSDEYHSVIHLQGRVLHQYIVDMFAKVEWQRLKYLQNNQATIRADFYQGVVDALALDATIDAAQVGRRVVLPSTYTGSPRFMHQLYQDAMAIVRNYGKPDLFITFTCNPGWSEITAEILPLQTAADRPNLCTRVFRRKLNALIDDLVKNSVLGKVDAFVYVVEFQKRGLPHAHILLILASDDKPRNADDYDAIVSAEIPDPAQHPKAHETVTKMMMHGPCGTLDLQSACMRDGKCSKGYPKTFVEQTESNEDGYPKYRRRNNDRHIVVRRNGRNVPLDNRWVVPHNLWLCTKYNAHVNVEICNSVMAVKYLFKYVYKGPDRAMMNVEPSDGRPAEVNEIRQFIDARFVSASEACWRLFAFPMQSHFPYMCRLAVHLPSQQTVYFRPDQDLAALPTSTSTLMAWFQLNQHDESAHQYTYAEIPKHYTWVKPRRIWKKRRDPSPIISRLYFVNPRDIQRYCLRLVLLKVRGATSFEDLRIVNGTMHADFRSAALAHGLLEDDEEWSTCLSEYAQVHNPRQLRHLFATILVFCNPSFPRSLWNAFSVDLCEDFAFAARRDNDTDSDTSIAEDIRHSALYHLDTILQANNQSLRNYPDLPQLPIDYCPVSLNEAAEADLSEDQTRHMIESLNHDQRAAFDAITSKVVNGEAGVFFLDGPAGTGKSFVYNTVIAHLRGLSKNIISVASSGIAALLLRGGRTAHSTFKIPLDIDAHSVCGIQKNTTAAQNIDRSDLIIWDEAPMQHRHVFEAVDRTFRDILDRPDTVFGGKVVVLGGDFRQILPVVIKGSQMQIENACIKNSRLIWPHVSCLTLTQNMRVARDDPSALQFADYLLKIGEGREETFADCRHTDNIRIPASMVLSVTSGADPLECLVRKIYCDPRVDYRDAHEISSRAILAAKNVDVDAINEFAVSIFPVPATTTSRMTPFSMMPMPLCTRSNF